MRLILSLQHSAFTKPFQTRPDQERQCNSIFEALEGSGASNSGQGALRLLLARILIQPAAGRRSPLLGSL